MKRITKKGFSLVELLVVIAILAVLAAILFPVLSSAKKSANRANDISNLHQLGIAGGLYSQKLDDSYPGELGEVAQSGLAPVSIFVSRNDDTKEGITNIFRTAPTGAPPYLKAYPFRASYIGMGDEGWWDSDIEQRFTTGTNAGWLICTAGQQPIFHGPENIQYVKGKYLRLLFTGSVIFRHFVTGTMATGGITVPTMNSGMLFCDNDAKWIDAQIIGPRR